MDKRGTRGSTAVDVSFVSSQALAEGMLQTPESKGPSTIDGFAIRKPMGPKAPPRETIYITNVKPQVIIDVAW